MERTPARTPDDRAQEYLAPQFLAMSPELVSHGPSLPEVFVCDPGTFANMPLLALVEVLIQRRLEIEEAVCFSEDSESQVGCSKSTEAELRNAAWSLLVFAFEATSLPSPLIGYCRANGVTKAEIFGLCMFITRAKYNKLFVLIRLFSGLRVYSTNGDRKPKCF